MRTAEDFNGADDTEAPFVAIINETFAQRFWPDREPLGQRFRARGQWRTVVGVAKSGKYNRLNEEPWCFFYLPYPQYVPDLDLNLCVRTRSDPAAFAGTLRKIVRDLDPGVELLRTQTLTDHVSAVYFPHRLASALLVLLGAVSLLLAAMGVYAVMACAVNQRTHEFGIRMALGARARDVLQTVILQGAMLAALGVVIGFALALLVTRLLESFLFGVSPFDGATFAAIALLLALVAVLACYLPARRASRVDPIIALRAE